MRLPGRPISRMPEPVQLYVYDLSNGMAQSLGPMLVGRPIEGIWVSLSLFSRSSGRKGIDSGRGERCRNRRGPGRGDASRAGSRDHLHKGLVRRWRCACTEGAKDALVTLEYTAPQAGSRGLTSPALACYCVQHTSLVLYGIEVWFGQGIHSKSPPGTTHVSSTIPSFATLVRARLTELSDRNAAWCTTKEDLYGRNPLGPRYVLRIRRGDEGNLQGREIPFARVQLCVPLESVHYSTGLTSQYRRQPFHE